MIRDNIINLLFLLPIFVVIVVYLVLRTSLKRASVSPKRRRPTKLSVQNRSVAKEIIFWPPEGFAPQVNARIQKSFYDADLGDVVMVVKSKLKFKIYWLFAVIIMLLCVDTYLGGGVLGGYLPPDMLDFVHYQYVCIAMFALMIIWSVYSTYKLMKKIVLYEYGFKVAPLDRKKYDYNAILNIEINEKRGGVACLVSLKNGKGLKFLSSQYANLKESMYFWKRNLFWEEPEEEEDDFTGQESPATPSLDDEQQYGQPPGYSSDRRELTLDGFDDDLR